VNGAAWNIDNITRRDIDAPILHHQIAFTPHDHHRAIVQLMDVGFFSIADLHEMMAYALTLTEGRNFDVFGRAKRVFSENFCNFGLLEFRPVLERNSRCWGTGKNQRQNKNRERAPAKFS
jgi:hypothetical protein